MSVRSLFARWSRPQCPGYDYTMPVILLILLVWYIPWYFSLPPGYDGDPYDMGVVILMLLFNYVDRLASWFKWRAAAAIHVLNWGWLIFALFYLVYWSRVLYPIHTLGGN